MKQPRHPEITVQLTGRDGNAFAVIGRVRQALRRARVPNAEIKQFIEEATSSDYDHLLQTVMEWVDAS